MSFQGLGIRHRNEAVMEERVSIARTGLQASEKAVPAAVASAIEAVCDLGALVRGKSVLVKPNVFAPIKPPGTTDPRVAAAVVRLALDAGAKKVAVGEGRSVSTAMYRSVEHRTTRACAEFTGLKAAVERAGADCIFFDEGDWLPADVDGQVLRRAQVARAVLECDVLINVPVMKNHSLTLVTLCLKNLHGILSDECKVFGHCYRDAQLSRKLVDILLIRKPDLNIVDAIRGMEGDHASGDTVEMGLVIAGTDAVAADAVCSALMGFEPGEIDTTRIAHERGLGVGDLTRISVVGTPIRDAARDFRRPDIAVREQDFPGLRVFGKPHCRSCEYYIRRGLDAAKDRGYFDGSRSFALVLDGSSHPPDDVPGKVIVAGDDALNGDWVKRIRPALEREGRFVALESQPPMEFRLRAPHLLTE
jgi:uncharacterized protein (DUF362 family)